VSLVLRWRIPVPPIATRWRGPAGLAEAIERDPLLPVAAVVGPPGSAETPVFPPLAIAANAPAPVPAGGTGSTAWSTWLNQPLFWDGEAWRTIGHFAEVVPQPDWVPEGAIVASDFVNGRYWRSDIGPCGLEDVWEAGAGYNGAWDPSMVIPDLGLIGSKMPQAVPEVLAILDPGGSGFTMVMDGRLAQGAGSAADCQFGAIFTESGYSNEWGGLAVVCSAANPQETTLNCGDYDGPVWTLGVPGVPFLGRHRIASSIRAEDVAVSLDGLATLTRTRAEFSFEPKSDPSWDMLVLACFDHDDAVGYVESVVFHPHRNASELNALSALTPAPANIVPPSILGAARVGTVLTATVGSWTHSPTSYSYQWRAGGIDIPGANSSTYLLTPAETGSAVTVAVTATNPGGESDPAVSAPTQTIVGAFFIDFTVGSLDPAVALSRASSGTYFDGDGQMQFASANAARFDHDPVTLVPRGLMVEPAATNLLSRSSEFDNAAWGKTHVTVSAGAAVAPDGTVTADKVVPTTTNDLHRVARGSIVNAAQVSLSVFASPAGYSKVALRDQGVAGAGAGFDLATASVISVSDADAAVSQTFVSGSRIGCTLTFGSAGNRNLAIHVLQPSFSGGSLFAPWAGNASDGVILWGAQMETGPVATSYIPTTSGTATRAKDEITVTVPAGYGELIFTHDDGSTTTVPCVEGANVFDADDFNRFHLVSCEGVA
jgi:hypothetical protein